MKIFIHTLLIISAFMSNAWAGKSDLDLKDEPEFNNRGVTVLKEKQEEDDPEDTERAAAPDASSAKSIMDFLPGNLLQIIVGFCDDPKAFLSTCRYMFHEIPCPLQLKITFPWDLLTSKTWAEMRENRAFFRWAKQVVEINLFEVNNCGDVLFLPRGMGINRVVEEQIVENASLLSTLRQVFPKATSICMKSEKDGLRIFQEAKKKDFRVTHFDAEAMGPIFRKVYLNDRRTRLFQRLFMDEEMVRDIQSRYVLDMKKYTNPNEPLLCIPESAKLYTMLDTFERFAKYPGTLNLNKLGRYRMIILLRVLSENPGLIPYVRQFNLYCAGLEKFFPPRKVGDLEIYKWESAVVLRFTNRLAHLMSPDFGEVFTLMTNQIFGVQAIPRTQRLAMEDLYLSFLDALGKRKSREDDLPLLKRTFALIPPLAVAEVLEKLGYNGISYVLDRIFSRMEETVLSLSDVQFEHVLAKYRESPVSIFGPAFDKLVSD